MRYIVALLCAGFVGAASARIVSVTSYVQLRDACQSALPGDTILIAAGTYTITGASRIMVTNRPGPVHVKGATGNRNDVVIQGQGQDNGAVQMVFNLDNCPNWTFRDLTVRNSYYHGFKFDHGSTDCRLINIVMRDHGESGVKGTSDPVAGTYPDRLLVDSCDIGFTSAYGGTRSVVEGVDGVGVNDWIIRYSRFVNIQKGGNPAYAIFTKGNSSNTIIEGNRFENCFIGASFGGGGTSPQYFRDNDQTYEHRNGIIRNNMIIRCTDAGIYINKGVNCKIYNNTVFECVLTIQLRFAESSGYVRNNLVKTAPTNPNEPIVRLRDGATFLANQANLAAVNSDFLVPAGSYAQLDLHLKAGSQAIDAGVNTASDVSTDFEGQARPVGPAFDVGADELGVIPVELSSFTVEAVHDGVLLRWRTESELNNAGFVIERSFAGMEFHPIAFIVGHGTTGHRQEYQHVDNIGNALSWVHYRLRQIDFDGREEVSHSVSIRVGPPSADELIVYPNPSHSPLFYSWTGGAPTWIYLFDTRGGVLDRQWTTGSGAFDIGGFPNGLYVIGLREADGWRTARFVKSGGGSRR